MNVPIHNIEFHGKQKHDVNGIRERSNQVFLPEVCGTFEPIFSKLPS